jgi:DNA-binding helix-turn-helix protein
LAGQLPGEFFPGGFLWIRYTGSHCSVHELHPGGLYLQLLGDQRSVAPHPEKECGEAESMRENLRAARKAKGMTQQAMADKLGISLVYYQKIEAGERTGDFSIWDDLEDITGIHQRILREIVRSHLARGDSQPEH